MSTVSVKSMNVTSFRRRNVLFRPFRWRNGFTRETGSGIVEMALVITILLAMLFGLMEMCLALYTYHFISEAAREGSRFATVRGSSCNSVNPSVTPCPAEPEDVQNYIQNLNYPGINPQAMTVTTTWSAYPAGDIWTCAPSAACNNPGNQVQVTVNYQYQLAIPFVPAATLNMSSTSQMVISQ